MYVVFFEKCEYKQEYKDFQPLKVYYKVGR